MSTEAISGPAALRTTLGARGLRIAWFSMGSVPLLEIGAAQGGDVAVIDLQHGLWDRMSAHLAVSTLGGKPVLMRTAANSVAAIGEALDSGAQGVLVPLVDTVEEAERAVAAATFPERGVRSGGGVRPLAEGFANYHARNLDPVIGIMIETRKGVENASAIAAVSGVDFVFIGAGDLALSLGCFPDIDERLEQACKAILEACRTVGTPCGIFTATVETARARLAEGYAVVVAANDLAVVTSGFADAAKALA